MLKLSTHAWVVTFATLDDVQNISGGVLGKAWASIEGMTRLSSRIDANSISVGRRQSRAPSSSSFSQYALAFSQLQTLVQPVYISGRLRCQVSPVTVSFTVSP